MADSSSTGFAKETPIETESKINNKHLARYQSNKQKRLREWCRWNGAYIYAYGCSLAGSICAIYSPLSDMYSFKICFIVRYQGKNLFPYVSEVIRSGISKYIFMIGCSVGFIPTAIFATNYFITAHDFNQLNKSCIQRFICEILNIVCSILLDFSCIDHLLMLFV